MGRMIVGRGAPTAPLKSLTTEDTEKGLGFDTAVGPGELFFVAGRRRNLETDSTTLSALLFSFFFLLCSPAACVVMSLFLFPDPPWPLPFALLVFSPLCSSAASVVMLLYSVSDRAWPLPSPAMELSTCRGWRGDRFSILRNSHNRRSQPWCDWSGRRIISPRVRTPVR